MIESGVSKLCENREYQAWHGWIEVDGRLRKESFKCKPGDGEAERKSHEWVREALKEHQQ